MNVVVFNTEAEAETRQVADLICHLEYYNDPVYVSHTTRWDTPLQRNDGKWTIACCEEFDYTGETIDTFDIADYPEGT